MQEMWGLSEGRVLPTGAVAVLRTVFKSHIIHTKYTKESTQVSDVTRASETITGILQRPRFHQLGTNEGAAVSPVSRSRR